MSKFGATVVTNTLYEVKWKRKYVKEDFYKSKTFKFRTSAEDFIKGLDTTKIEVVSFNKIISLL